MKKGTYILLTIICSLILIGKTYAAPDVTPGIDPVDGGDSAGSCGGNNCYSTGSSGVRISIVDNNGNRVAGTNSYDYWFSSSNAQARYMSGSSYCFKTKYQKKEVMGLSSVNSYMQSCPKSFVDISELGVSGSYNSPQDVDKFVKKIVALGNDQEAKNNANHANWAPFNKIFKAINFKNSAGKQITIQNISKKDMENRYLQFEPLVSFKNHGAKVTNSMFYGTISEIIKIGNLGGYNNAFGSAIVSYLVAPKYIGVEARAGKKYPSGYYAGVPSNVTVDSFGEFLNKINNKYYASGVGFISFDDLDIPTCNPDADIIVNDYTKFLDKDGKKASSLLDAWKKLIEKYETEIQTTFTYKDPNTNVISFNAFNKDVITIMKGNNFKSSITNQYIGSPTGYPSNNQFVGKRCNVTYECQEIADAIYNKYYNTNKEDYEKYIKKLQDVFPDNLLLKTAYWTELGYNGPRCKNFTITECNPSYEKGECTNTSNVFTYSDSTKKECWQKGIAYNSNEYIQSSIYQRMGNGCFTYCTEKATFTFPTDVNEKTKAGTTFKWGVDNSKDIFGTMNVTMTCTIGKPNDTTYDCSGNYTIGQSGNLNVKLLNTDSANTIVKILYDEPSSDLDIDKGNITAILENSITNKTAISCNDKNCSNKPEFVLNAKYNLTYNDKKMYWYSNKEDGSLVNGNDYNSSNKAYYYEIGYGLPTAFTTSTGTYGKDGELTAQLNNPGTKNIVNEQTKGHFTKLLKDKTGKEYLDYSCKFKVKNELYENECQYDEAGNLISGSPEYCPEVKDIDVIFRTVELYGGSNKKEGVARAFPGRTGTSRVIGSNWWLKLTEADGTPTLTDDDKINRIAEILDDNVYSESHLQYRIKLDSTVIRDIRKYNKEVRKAGFNPYSDFKIINSTHDEEIMGYFGYTCYEKDDKKHCASHLISKLATDGIMTGNCVTGNKRISYNRAKLNIDGC